MAFKLKKKVILAVLWQKEAKIGDLSEKKVKMEVLGKKKAILVVLCKLISNKCFL